MFNINDPSLKEIQPSSLSWEEFKEDCEIVFDEGGFHSDEVSETDEELIKKEIEEHTRPKNKLETDKHVLRVYDKPWRSRRVSKIKSIYCAVTIHLIYYYFFFILIGT